MKTRVLLIAAGAFAFTSCDGEKAQEAKQKTVDAAKAIGEATKEVTGKVVEKTKEFTAHAGEKLKSATEAAKTVIAEKGGPALESFKVRMGGLSEWFKGAKGQAGEDPAKAHELMGEMMNKVKAIPSEGLPPDLQSAFERYRGAMNRVQEVSRSLPTDAAAAEQWYMDNSEKLGALEQDVVGALKLLKDAAAKHGITGLDLGNE